MNVVSRRLDFQSFQLGAASLKAPCTDDLAMRPPPMLHEDRAGLLLSCWRLVGDGGNGTLDAPCRNKINPGVRQITIPIAAPDGKKQIETGKANAAERAQLPSARQCGTQYNDL